MDLAKQNRINKEMKRLIKLFDEVPKDLLSTVSSLVQNAAFMSISLEDLQDAINTKGFVDTYQHGSGQFGTKKTPEIEIYNTMIKNHASIMRQLVDLLPASDGVKKKDQLLEFLKK